MGVDKILEEREKTHGKFEDHASISQGLKRIASVNLVTRNLDDSQRESIDMILHKIARILNGDANYKDHWDDIAGYATLISKELI